MRVKLLVLLEQLCHKKDVGPQPMVLLETIGLESNMRGRAVRPELVNCFPTDMATLLEVTDSHHTKCGTTSTDRAVRGMAASSVKTSQEPKANQSLSSFSSTSPCFRIVLFYPFGGVKQRSAIPARFEMSSPPELMCYTSHNSMKYS